MSTPARSTRAPSLRWFVTAVSSLVALALLTAALIAAPVPLGKAEDVGLSAERARAPFLNIS